MRVAAFLVAAIGLFAAAIAAFAPATLVDARLASLSEGQLRISDASGTIWSGHGALTDMGGTWRMPLAWRLSPMTLARGAPAVTLLPVAGATPAGTISADGNGASLSQFSAELPAHALAALLPAREAIALGGTIAVAAAAFSFDGTRGAGALSATWRGARVQAGGRSLDLGTVQLALLPQDRRLSGTISNSGGDVRMNGTATLADNALTVDGTLAPTPNAAADVAGLLSTLGPADGNGAVRVGYRGKLR